jgi:membrane-bound serine protease (ClpP class)
LGTAVILAFGFAFIFIAVQAISIAIVLSAIVFFLSSRLFPESAFFKRVAFDGVQGPEYVTSADFRSLTGKTGFATSYLRPSGVASIEGKRVDVLTEGDFVPAGSPIRVNRVEGARIFVRPLVEEK